MKVEEISIEKIIPYGLNNRIHSEEQIERIAKSISEFGFNQPIVVDEDNVILVGHGRLEAAKKLELSKVPTLKVLNLSEENKKAYRILDNKLQNDSTWNFENLELELDFLKTEEFDIEAFGLDVFQDSLQNKEVVPEEFDESIVKNVSFDQGFKILLLESDMKSFEEALDELLIDFPNAKKKKM